MTVQESDSTAARSCTSQPIGSIIERLYYLVIHQVLSRPFFPFYQDGVLEIRQYSDFYTINDNVTNCMFSAVNEGGRLRIIRVLLPLCDRDTAAAFMQEAQARLDAVLRRYHKQNKEGTLETALKNSDTHSQGPFISPLDRLQEIIERRGVAFRFGGWEGYFFPDTLELWLHYIDTNVAGVYSFEVKEGSLCVVRFNRLFIASDGQPVDMNRANWLEVHFIRKVNSFMNSNYWTIVRAIRAKR